MKGNGIVRPLGPEAVAFSTGPGSMTCPGRDRIWPFPLFPANRFTLWVLDAVSKQSVWVAGEAALHAFH